MTTINHPDYYDIANITELFHNFSITDIPSNVCPRKVHIF